MPAFGMTGMPDVLARNLIDKAVIGSDGTELGTTQVSDINSGVGSSSPTDLLLDWTGTQVYFRAFESTTGTELWRTGLLR